MITTCPSQERTTFSIKLLCSAKNANTPSSKKSILKLKGSECYHFKHYLNIFSYESTLKEANVGLSLKNICCSAPIIKTRWSIH